MYFFFVSLCFCEFPKTGDFGTQAEEANSQEISLTLLQPMVEMDSVY